MGTGGKVIVTTQNINIEATNLTNSGDTIFVGNLTPEEKLNLFLKILYGCDECGFSEKLGRSVNFFDRYTSFSFRCFDCSSLYQK